MAKKSSPERTSTEKYSFEGDNVEVDLYLNQKEVSFRVLERCDSSLTTGTVLRDVKCYKIVKWMEMVEIPVQDVVCGLSLDQAGRVIAELDDENLSYEIREDT